MGTPKQLNLSDQDIPDVVQDVLHAKKKKEELNERLSEVEDRIEEVEIKAEKLANAIKECGNVVVFTGAGVSTAASIPDYRGPNGVWRKIARGDDFER